MYARLLAFACLLSCSVLIGRAEPMLAPVATVGVYLKADVSASSLSLQSMRTELRNLLAPAGVTLQWLDAKSNNAVGKLIAVDLRGTCQFGSDKSEKFKNHSALASTAVTDGRVLPFSWVDCVALDQFLRPALKGQPSKEQDESYGRAMGRLLAHEFYHVLAQTESHTQGGISKTSFSVADLLANHFTFHTDALALIQVEQSAPTLAYAPADSEEALLESDNALESEVALAAR